MRQTRSQRGFTLIEVLFAVFIIAGALVIFAGVMMGSTRQARSGSSVTQAVFAATEIIEMEAAAIKRAGVPNLACGLSPATTKSYGNTTYTITTDVTKLVLDPASGDLTPAGTPATNCHETEPAAYELSLVLAWTQDGVPMQETYSEVIATGPVTAPVVDYFRTVDGGDTYFIADPTIEDTTTLEWQTTIGTQPLDVRVTGTDGSVRRGLRHSDSLEVTPTKSTRYSLRVANDAGDQSRAATVFVDDIEIDAFEAFPPIVGPDETFELAWTYTATFDPEFEIATLNPGNVDVSAETADPSEETRTAAGPITADTTYSLTVDTNHPVEADRQTIAAATTGVQYSTEPILDRFAVTPQMVCRTPGGTLVDLDWLVYAASSIRLDGGPFANAAVAREGTDTALVNDSTTFTLTATNALGVARSASRDVELLEYPAITFTANGTPTQVSIVLGEAALLEWVALHADRVDLAGTPYSTSGSVSVEPLANTTYILNASNQGYCDNSATVRVIVEPIDFNNVHFDVSKTTAGYPATLQWDYTNTLNPTYHQVRLTEIDAPGRPQHDVTNWTSFTVTPESVGEHEYLLELIDRDSGGTGAPKVIASHLVTLQAIEPPRIDDFTANPAHVCEGNSSVLTWATSFATTVTLTSWGDVPLSGSRLVTPTGTTTYTLDAVNELGHPPLDPATVTVTTTPRPVVNFFRADPSPVAEATPTTLEWSIVGADRASISGLGPVDPNGGSLPINPSGSTTYYLTAEVDAPSGEACATTVPLSVTVEPITITRFTSDFPAITRQGRQRLSWEISPYIDPDYHMVALRGDTPQTDVTEVTGGENPSFGAHVATTTRNDGSANFYLDVWELNASGAPVRILDTAHLSLPTTQLPELRKPLAVSPSGMCSPGGAVTVSFEYRYGTGTLTWPGNPDGLHLGTTHTPPFPGSVNTTVNETTEFELAVTNPAGDSVYDTATVTVTPAPVINDFTADAAWVYRGQAVKLEWDVSGAHSVSVAGQTGLPNLGSLTVTPHSKTTYTLTASVPGCPPVSRTVTVDVLHPSIAAFSAVRTSTALQTSTTVAWDVPAFNSTYYTARLHEQQQSILGGGGRWMQIATPTTASGQVTITPDILSRPGLRYRLEIFDRDTGARVDLAEVAPKTQIQPAISTFTSNVTTLCTTGSRSVTFTWSTSHASSVTFNGTAVAASGSRTVTARPGDTFTLRVANEFGTASRTITTPGGTVPTVTSVTAPSRALANQAYRLQWTTSNAARVRVSGLSGTYNANSSVNVSHNASGNKTYTVTAESSTGCTATRSVTVAHSPAVLQFRHYQSHPDHPVGWTYIPACTAAAHNCQYLTGNGTTVGTVTVAGSYSSFSGRNVEITVPQSGATNTTTFPNGMYIWKAYHGDRAILRRAGIQEGAVHQWYPSVRFNNLGSSWQSFRYVLEYKICNCMFAQDRSYQANYRVRFNGNNFEMQSTYTNIYLPHNAASGWNHSAAYIRLQARIFQ